MEKIEAAQLFSLSENSNEEEIVAAIELKLFEWKKEVMQKYMVPALLRNKVQMIQQLMLAEFILNNEKNSASGHEVNIWVGNPTDRIVFIEEYEAQISKLKLALMNSTSFHQLHKVMHVFILTQEYFMVLFKMFFNEFSEALPEEVNTREIIDTGKLLLALKSGILDNKQTWEIEIEITRIDKIQKLKAS